MISAGFVLPEIGKVPDGVVVFRGDINGDRLEDRVVKYPGVRFDGQEGMIRTEVVLGTPSGDVVLNIDQWPFMPYGWPVEQHKGIWTRFRFQLLGDAAPEDRSKVAGLKFRVPQKDCGMEKCPAVSFGIGDKVSQGRIGDIAIDLDINGRFVGAAAYYTSGNEENTYEHKPVVLSRLNKVQSLQNLRKKAGPIAAKLRKRVDKLLDDRCIASEQFDLLSFQSADVGPEERRELQPKFNEQWERMGAARDGIAKLIAESAGRSVPDRFGRGILIGEIVKGLDLPGYYADTAWEQLDSVPNPVLATRQAK